MDIHARNSRSSGQVAGARGPNAYRMKIRKTGRALIWAHPTGLYAPRSPRRAYPEECRASTLRALIPGEDLHPSPGAVGPTSETSCAALTRRIQRAVRPTIGQRLA